MATDRANVEEVGMPEVAEFLLDLLAGGIRRPSAHQGRPVVRQSVLLTVRLAGPKAEDGVQVSRIPEAWLARFGKAPLGAAPGHRRQRSLCPATSP